ncbi:AAA family ATPase [Acidipila sp. 4G-K13]|nr:cellulose synthase operon protein YhjQ/BcsQ [Paracidobacterium acidisoli]MBT9330119.1 AAA family ATPase [Paracidobacterium acidisoli]
MAIYSLAGGVGKTTISANLGRILCSMGERVLLVDASGSGLLPFYFGSSDLRPGIRTFVDPDGQYPPMRVVGETDGISSAWLDDAVRSAMQSAQRVVFDLGPASMSILPQILCKCSVLLVPLLTDLNSILTVSRIEASVSAMLAKGMNVPQPVYVFNLFNEQSPRDQQARELVSRQCGDRLLPVTIHYSQELDDAIASRMTAADHAPDSEVVNDYSRLAAWLRRVSPVRQGARSVQRWMER